MEFINKEYQVFQSERITPQDIKRSLGLIIFDTKLLKKQFIRIAFGSSGKFEYNGNILGYSNYNIFNDKGEIVACKVELSGIIKTTLRVTDINTDDFWVFNSDYFNYKFLEKFTKYSGYECVLYPQYLFRNFCNAPMRLTADSNTIQRVIRDYLYNNYSIQSTEEDVIPANEEATIDVRIAGATDPLDTVTNGYAETVLNPDNTHIITYNVNNIDPEIRGEVERMLGGLTATGTLPAGNNIREAFNDIANGRDEPTTEAEITAHIDEILEEEDAGDLPF